MPPPKTPRKRTPTKRTTTKRTPAKAVAPRRKAPTRRPAAPVDPTDAPSEPEIPAGGANLAAAAATIEALREGGRLENCDLARIAALLSLAAAVDADPANASLWREYRAVEASLREVDDDAQEDFEAIVSRLSASVGNAKDAGKGKSRATGSRRS